MPDENERKKKIVDKLVEDDMCCSMGEARRLVENLEAHGKTDEFLSKTYKKHGKEWKDPNADE